MFPMVRFSIPIKAIVNEIGSWLTCHSPSKPIKAWVPAFLAHNADIIHSFINSENDKVSLYACPAFQIILNRVKGKCLLKCMSHGWKYDSRHTLHATS